MPYYRFRMLIKKKRGFIVLMSHTIVITVKKKRSRGYSHVRIILIINAIGMKARS